MQRTLIRRAQYGLENTLPTGVQPFKRRVKDYKSFKSQYGPDYKIGAHVSGINMSNGLTMATLAAGFGGVAGIFALFFFDGVPRVQRDILQKIPFIADYYTRSVPPEDNPF